MRDPKDAQQRLEAMKSDRSNYETVWEKIAGVVRPIREEFVQTPTEGTRRGRKIYDSTGIMANDNLAAGIYGAMSNPANKWMGLRAADPELNERSEVREALDDAADTLLASFGTGVTKFYNEIPTLYADVAAFGTAVHYSAERPSGGGILDKVMPLSECFIAANEDDDVDTLYREYKMTARQIVSQWGMKAHPKTRDIAEKNPHQKCTILHLVEPNKDFKEGALGPKGMAFLSQYIELDHRSTVHVGGYEEFPYQVPRWALASGELYGRGRGEQALSDLQQLQAMVKTNIRAGQMVADPPLLGPDEGAIKVARLYAGGYTPGAVSRNGRQLVFPLSTGGNVPVTLEMVQDIKIQIREAFFASLLMMADRADMTATEVLQRQEEKMRLLGPNLGRIQAEFLSPLIKRRFNMLVRTGDIPREMFPPELAGQSIEIEYVSPLVKQQRAAEALSVTRTIETIGGMSQMFPGVLDLVDEDEAGRRIAEGYGAPASILRGQDEVAALREARQQQEQMMQMAAMAEPVAGAMDKGASAIQKLQGGQ